MPANDQLDLMAHLIRRAGFGANRDDLDAYLVKGYAETVEELLVPEPAPAFEDDLAFRYVPYFRMGTGIPSFQSYWMYRMITTKRPLEEKMTLFWHHIFATSHSKMNRNPQMEKQLRMFRRNALGDFRTILTDLAKDPAMIYWLDNNENHNGAPNENFGRELLELFSMGVGMDGHANYTENDVKECARAFTGWTMAPALPRYPYGDHCWDFEYCADDHDEEEKSFLGQTGNFNGDDIINIIVEQPATARFISRHLYNFFVADEPQVPAWSVTPPNNPEAIETIAQALRDSNYDIRSALRVLLKSDFFKNARYTRIKSHAEVVVGALRLVGGYDFPSPGIGNLSKEPGYMGQELLNPPSVEGWHTGSEWINSGSLMARINFTADLISDTSRPGVQNIINRLKAQGDLFPEAFVDTCLDLMGPLEVGKEVRQELVDHAGAFGALKWGSEQDSAASTDRVSEMLQLVVSTRDYQYA